MGCHESNRLREKGSPKFWASIKLNASNRYLCVSVGTMVAQALCAQDIASYFEASFPDGLEMVNQATFIARPFLTHLAPCCIHGKPGKTLTVIGQQKATEKYMFIFFSRIYILQGSCFINTKVDYQCISSSPQKGSHFFLSGLNQIWGHF